MVAKLASNSLVSGTSLQIMYMHGPLPRNIAKISQKFLLGLDLLKGDMHGEAQSLSSKGSWVPGWPFQC
jgi:hypothetical protein